MADIHVENASRLSDESDNNEDESISNDEDVDSRLSDVDGDVSSEDEDDNSTEVSTPAKSGMANVIAKILSKDTSSSNKALLAKGKTEREILKDISKRRGEKNDTTDKKDSDEIHRSDTELIKIEKRKLWECMGRRTPSEMDLPREAKLRKIATQGMVQLFQSVHEHQKMLNQKIASVGPSERKKDKVVAEFTKGKFLDLLKGKKPTESKAKEKEARSQASDPNPKWKILQDDFMMGARMKDWDKDDDSDENSSHIEEGDAYSSHRISRIEDDMSDDD